LNLFPSQFVFYIVPFFTEFFQEDSFETNELFKDSWEL